MTAARGEVWEYADPSAGRARVVVVSSDVHNERPNAWPLCALVTRHSPATEIPLFTVALADPDPLGGHVITSTVRGLDPQGLDKRLGMLTGSTMVDLGRAIRDLFDLD
ncbi:MAG: type II toxin-antitoxin system PemK/MazF family toxin [Haloechinothrix sp.]